jgi:hypothetical protein
MNERPLRTIAAAALLFCAPLARAVADHIPVPPQGVVELQGRTAAFLDLGDLELLGELEGRLEDTDHHFGYRAVTLGGYYRVLRNLKVGAFYRLASGVRHDDDWIVDPSPPPGWIWQDTTGRLEHELILDASPRILLDFLPGRDWVLMLKARWFLSSFEMQQSVLLRPQLTYFWMLDREPFLSISLSYDAYIPLNFGQLPLYEQYPYLSVGWHVTPELTVELAGAYRSILWSAGAPVIASGESLAGYPVTFTSWVAALSVVYRLGR